MRPFPIGIDDFRKLRENDYYYADKTMFIKELLDNRGEVSLFTRPRRFGKTLGISMLKYFFEDECGARENRYLFEGLEIMEAGEKYLKHMGKYPVISLSMKTSKQPSFKMAYECLQDEIAQEFDRHSLVLASDKLNEAEKKQYREMMNKQGPDSVWAKALDFLSRCLKKVYQQNVIILLDEYDVPLENAYLRGFYGKMTDFIRSLFESALKSNPNLEFAVITGCIVSAKADPLGESSILRCRGKESIFTGLNNLEIISLMNHNYAEHFGFTQSEVEHLLAAYGLQEKQQEVQQWYDGYLFGDTEVYNPWSVLNYVKAAVSSPQAFPQTYWANTSSNDIVKKLVELADGSIRQEMESLIEGGTIEKPVHEEITYDEVYKSEDNLWNFLFFTGYLKKQGERFDGETLYLTLAIPNTEVKLIYRNTILDWFDEKIRQKDLTGIYNALLKKDTQLLEIELSKNLMETISFYDYREDYYHGFLGGLLKMMDGYTIKSNRESGLGRSDLLLLSAPYIGKAIIIELKVADTFAMLDETAAVALEQIREKQYGAELMLEGYRTFTYYGIAFYKKTCRVLTEA